VGEDEVKRKESVMNTRFILIALMLAGSASTVQAEVITKEISYQHDDVNFEGFLAYDDSVKGKRPAVLVVHEWWGLNDYVRSRARQLASMGYVAFALDMYGKGKVTQHPSQAGEWANQIRSDVHQWQQRALAGLEVLKKDPRTDINRIAAIGYCFGGSTVQQLAYSGADIKGVVSFHGSLVLPPNAERQKVKAKILICHGAADPLTKRGEIEQYIAAMEKAGLDYEMIIYGGAKHGFTNPEADKFGMDPVKYSKSADLRSWADMKVFFAEIFQ
jgi:dienelactone hydrolase